MKNSEVAREKRSSKALASEIPELREDTVLDQMESIMRQYLVALRFVNRYQVGLYVAAQQPFSNKEVERHRIDAPERFAKAWANYEHRKQTNRALRDLADESVELPSDQKYKGALAYLRRMENTSGPLFKLLKQSGAQRIEDFERGMWIKFLEDEYKKGRLRGGSKDEYDQSLTEMNEYIGKFNEQRIIRKIEEDIRGLRFQINDYRHFIEASHKSRESSMIELKKGLGEINKMIRTMVKQSGPIPEIDEKNITTWYETLVNEYRSLGRTLTEKVHNRSRRSLIDKVTTYEIRERLRQLQQITDRIQESQAWLESRSRKLMHTLNEQNIAGVAGHILHGDNAELKQQFATQVIGALDDLFKAVPECRNILLSSEYIKIAYGMKRK